MIRLIITLATDGILYAIDPVTGCRERFDVGDISDTMVRLYKKEKFQDQLIDIFSQILYEDLDDSGTMDILLTSTSGNVLAIETKTPIIPLNSWFVISNLIFISNFNFFFVGLKVSWEKIFLHTKKITEVKDCAQIYNFSLHFSAGIYFTEHTQKFLSGQTINIYFCIEDQVFFFFHEAHFIYLFIYLFSGFFR